MWPETPSELPIGLFVLALGIGAIAYGFWCIGRTQLALAVGLLGGLCLAGAAAPSLAQTAEELVAKVQARTAQQSDAAQALFEGTRQRQDAYRDEARVLVSGAPAQLSRGFASLDGAAFGDAAPLATLGETAPSTGIVYVAVSFSMPPADLRALGRAAHKAGVELVIRGLVQGSFGRTLLAARQVFDEDSLGGVAIDPNVFRAFDIQATPTFIAAATPVQPCGKGLDCVPAAPANDTLSGNISLAEALRILKTRGEAGASAAQAAADRLGR